LSSIRVECTDLAARQRLLAVDWKHVWETTPTDNRVVASAGLVLCQFVKAPATEMRKLSFPSPKTLAG